MSLRNRRSDAEISFLRFKEILIRQTTCLDFPKIVPHTDLCRDRSRATGFHGHAATKCSSLSRGPVRQFYFHSYRMTHIPRLVHEEKTENISI